MIFKTRKTLEIILNNTDFPLTLYWVGSGIISENEKTYGVKFRAIHRTHILEFLFLRIFANEQDFVYIYDVDVVCHKFQIKDDIQKRRKYKKSSKRK